MKERLTGAILLVALIVAVVPEVLRGPLRPSSRTASSSEPASPRSYVIHLGEDAHSRASDKVSGPAAPAPLASSTAIVATAAEPAPALHPAASAGATAPTPAPAPSHQPSQAGASAHTAAAAPAGAGGWVVQLGSFRSRANADRLARQASTNGFKASVSQGSSGARLYRVRVGPVSERDAANALAARIQAAGLSGAVVPE